MKKLDKICIIGLGLIGGSIGLDARRRRLAREVWGLVRRRVSIREALRRDVVDHATLEPEEAVAGAGMIVIATPLSCMGEIASVIRPFVASGAVVSDVGSSKRCVVGPMEKIFHPRAHFVGAHPIAGSEQSGMRAAHANLFAGAPCILTPSGRTDRSALKKVAAFWRSLGSRVSLMSPREHDHIAAAISHLPHFLSAALVNASVKTLRHEKTVLDYAGSGFKDITRVASSDAGMWVDIGMCNADAILCALEALDEQLAILKKALRHANLPTIRNLLSSASTVRRKMNA